MTQFYYIASSKELSVGSFGKKKTDMTVMDYVTHVNPTAKDHLPMQILLEKYPQGDKLMEIYETKLDAVGLYIAGPITDQVTSHLFLHPLVYEVHPDGGSFHINDEIKEAYPTSYEASKKCIAELFEYLSRHIEVGEELELYSCWASGLERFLEPPIRELDLVLHLSAFQLGNEFEWKDCQFIRVKR